MISKAALTTGTLQALIAFFLVTKSPAQAGGSDLISALRLQVLSKKFILRNFSAESAIHAHATVSGLDLTETHLKSFSLITVSDVEKEGDHVLLKGTKQYVLHNGPMSWGYANQSEPLVIDIQLDQGTSKVTATAMIDQLFYKSIDTAIAALDLELARSVPGYAQSERTKHPKQPTCDCSKHGTSNCLNRSAEEGYKHPEMIHHEDIGLPQGDPPGSSWNAESLLQIADSGKVETIWVLQATNAMSQEAALKAGQAYRFKPATCHGSPIASYVYVNFSYARP